MRLKALTGATLIALAAGATFEWRPPPPAAPDALSNIPPPEKVAALQAQAEVACRCARTRSDTSGKRDCWAAFERAISPWPHGPSYSACEFSERSICFGDGFPADACVTRGWSAPAVDGVEAICTREELQTAEAVWLEALGRDDKDGTKSADRALKRTLEGFARDDRYALRRVEGGCGRG